MRVLTQRASDLLESLEQKYGVAPSYTTKLAAMKMELTDFYSKHDTTRVSTVDHLLNTNSFEEVTMMIRGKYNALPPGWAPLEEDEAGKSGEQGLDLGALSEGLGGLWEKTGAQMLNSLGSSLSPANQQNIAPGERELYWRDEYEAMCQRFKEAQVPSADVFGDHFLLITIVPGYDCRFTGC